MTKTIYLLFLSLAVVLSTITIDTKTCGDSCSPSWCINANAKACIFEEPRTDMAASIKAVPCNDKCTQNTSDEC